MASLYICMNICQTHDMYMYNIYCYIFKNSGLPAQLHLQSIDQFDPDVEVMNCRTSTRSVFDLGQEQSSGRSPFYCLKFCTEWGMP